MEKSLEMMSRCEPKPSAPLEAEWKMNDKPLRIGEAFAAHPFETFIVTMAEIFLDDMEYSVFMLALYRTSYLMVRKNPIPDEEALHANVILDDTFKGENRIEMGGAEGAFDSSPLLHCFPALINKGFLARYSAQDESATRNYSCKTRFYFDPADFLYRTTAKLLSIRETIKSERERLGKVTNVEFECSRCHATFSQTQSALIHKLCAHRTHICPNCRYPELRRAASRSASQTAKEAQLLEYQANVVEELTQMGLNLCQKFNQHQESLCMQLRGIKDRYAEKKSNEETRERKKLAWFYQAMDESGSDDDPDLSPAPQQQEATEALPQDMWGAQAAISSGSATGMSLAHALASNDFTFGGSASKLGVASARMSRKRLRLEHEGIDPASLLRQRKGTFWRSSKVAINTLDGSWAKRMLPWFKKVNRDVHRLLDR